MRLVASALVLALVGLGGFWVWQEALDPALAPQSGVVVTATGGMPSADVGVARPALPRTGTTDPLEARVGPAVSRVVGTASQLADEFWSAMSLGLDADDLVPTGGSGPRAGTETDTPSATAPATTQVGTSGARTTGPVAVLPEPVDPDRDDDDDRDDDGRRDGQDDDDEDDDDGDDDGPDVDDEDDD